MTRKYRCEPLRHPRKNFRIRAHLAAEAARQLEKARLEVYVSVQAPLVLLRPVQDKIPRFSSSLPLSYTP